MLLRAAILLSCFVLFALRGEDEASATPRRDATGQNARDIPNATFVDQHGRERKLYDDVIAGHAVVVQFMYTQCDGVCPASKATLVEAQSHFPDEFGRALRFVSISLDANDGPDELADYASSRGMADGWILLSGKPEDVESVRRAVGAYDPDPEVDAVRSNHSAGLVLGNDAKDRWTMASGLGSTAALVRSIRRIL